MWLGSLPLPLMVRPPSSWFHNKGALATMCLRQGDPRAVLAAAGFPAGSTDEYEKEASFLGTHGDPWVPKCTLNPIWSDEEQLLTPPPFFPWAQQSESGLEGCLHCYPYPVGLWFSAWSPNLKLENESLRNSWSHPGVGPGFVESEALLFWRAFFKKKNKNV